MTDKEGVSLILTVGQQSNHQYGTDLKYVWIYRTSMGSTLPDWGIRSRYSSLVLLLLG